MGRLHLLAGMLMVVAPAALAQGSASTPTCPAGTQVTTPGSTSDPKLAATQGAGQPGARAPAPAAPPDPAANTAVRVGNGLARLPDGTLCRPLGG
jgi:hypothetical protein